MTTIRTSTVLSAEVDENITPDVLRNTLSAVLPVPRTLAEATGDAGCDPLDHAQKRLAASVDFR